MADFDDLLSSSRQQKSTPFLDNPFQDVFDGVSGRSREPDPWSTGGWGQPEQHPAPSAAADFAYPSTTSPPVSPVAFDNTSGTAAAAVDEPLHAESPQTPGFRSHHEQIPETSSTESKGAEPPAPESHSDPLEVPPTVPVPVDSAPPVPIDPTPRPTPDTLPPPPLVIETPAEQSSPDQRRVSLSEQRGKGPLSALVDRSNATLTSRVTPAIPPSPMTPYPITPSTTSSSFSTTSTRERSSSRTLAESSPSINYNRIVSPLDTPASQAGRMPLENNFNNLALGGEAPGWGATTKIYPAATNGEQEGWGNGDDYHRRDDSAAQVERSPSHSVATVKENAEEQSIEDVPSSEAPPPVFTITVGDPQKIGDPIKAHIVYTVHTKTTSPEFAKSTFSVLRRYSDFLWLYEALSANNPGIIVPPVPDKNPLSVSRFEAAFVEGRRFALERCVSKMASHPVLSKDADLRFFLESDSFALDIKHRRQETSQGSGLLATFGSLAAPKFYEVDEWFDNKRAYLDALESQLKGLVKAIDMVSKQRAEFAVSLSEFADTIAALSVSDLSKQLTSTLSVLADVERLYKDLQDSQVKDDMVTVMGAADEYSRLISSVRLAFNSRIKLYFASQTADSEFRRIKSTFEKQRRQGRTTGSMAEIADAERRAIEAKREYDTVTKLIKMELARFEMERVEDFKVALEQFLHGMIKKQKTLIQAWEKYQDVLLKRAGSNPTLRSSEDTTNGVAADAEDI